MLTAIPMTDPAKNVIRLERHIKKNGRIEACHHRSAFAFSEKPVFTLHLARKIGVCRARMALISDKTAKRTVLDFYYTDTQGAVDTYELTLPLDTLCENEPNGLFYFQIELLLGTEIRYLSSINNIDFSFAEDEKDISLFRLLVYADGYQTPKWAKNAVMYHIFVDRFATSGEKYIPVREGAVLNTDWEHGVPKYAPYPGAPLDNNEFFGGNLYGVAEKLDYLKDMGVNLLYLSPIFKAYSNHKYDTGNYMTVDEMFGGDEAFAYLLKQAKKRGIRVILDGVFNHTGDDSLYFNRYGRYPGHDGAYQKEDSPYHDWYCFEKFPDKYDSWWGIDILPKLNNNNPDTRNYFLGENGVVRKYLKMGIAGWRLDVADELPSDFLTELRTAVKTESPDALVLGEVWENAADKIAYGYRREYLSGFQLDSVMNYPIKNAIIDYIKTADAEHFYHTVTDIYSSYPPEVSAVLMNLIGTHDTERILTVLGEKSAANLSNDRKATKHLSAGAREKAVHLLKIASLLQFTLPGMPSVFYGDEAGLEGYGDPFCRRPYPWGREDKRLIEHYKTLMHLKRDHAALHNASLDFASVGDGVIVFRRTSAKETLAIVCNLAPCEKAVTLDGEWETVYAVAPVVSLQYFGSIDLQTEVRIPSQNAVIIVQK